MQEKVPVNTMSKTPDQFKDGIAVAVGAIIKDKEGKILLVKHIPARGGYWQGKWICPGGKLMPGETIEEGIKREIREETHLEVRLISPLIPFERIVKVKDQIDLHVIYIDYIGEVVGGELKPGDDVGEAIWVDQKEIPKIKSELHEDTVRLLKIGGIIER